MSMEKLPDDVIKQIFECLMPWSAYAPGTYMPTGWQNEYWNLALTCKRFFHIGLATYKHLDKSGFTDARYKLLFWLVKGNDNNEAIIRSTEPRPRSLAILKDYGSCPIHSPFVIPNAKKRECFHWQLYPILSFKYFVPGVIHFSQINFRKKNCLSSIDTSKLDGYYGLVLQECILDAQALGQLLAKFKSVNRLTLEHCLYHDTPAGSTMFLERTLEILQIDMNSDLFRDELSEKSARHDFNRVLLHPNLKIPTKRIMLRRLELTLKLGDHVDDIDDYYFTTSYAIDYLKRSKNVIEMICMESGRERIWDALAKKHKLKEIPYCIVYDRDWCYE